jgi:hypothetical protein
MFVLQDVTPCSSVDMYQHFGETYCLFLQGRIAVVSALIMEAVDSCRMFISKAPHPQKTVILKQCCSISGSCLVLRFSNGN